MLVDDSVYLDDDAANVASQLSWLFEADGADCLESALAAVPIDHLTAGTYQQLFNTPSDPSPSSSLHVPQGDGLHDILRTDYPVAESPEPISRVPKKRRRDVKVGDDQSFALQSEAIAANAARQLKTAFSNAHPLCSLSVKACSAPNCFAMSPLGDNPSDYHRKPLRFGKLNVQIFDSSNSPNEMTYENVGTFNRLTGRSIHLIVTELPLLRDVKQLDLGFALILACRKVHGVWQPACFVSFEGSQQHKSRARTNEVAFRGNLEHCTGEKGRRIWGLRSSHVRRSSKLESLKPLRLTPKGPVGINLTEEFSFFVALFDLQGSLIRHIDGSPCIAQSNTVCFEPSRAKQADGSMSALMREINKLSLFERADLSTLPTIPESLRTMLITTDEAMLARLGVQTYTAENRPRTSIELSIVHRTFDADGTAENEYAYRSRVRAVAYELGVRHADPALTDSTRRFLAIGSTSAVEVRYQQIGSSGLQEAVDWLKEHGIHQPKMATIVERAELTGFLMRDLRFQSSWTVGINNVYPDRILVDAEDTNKVHCLANTTYEADIALRDRMASLARFAFCAKVQRNRMSEDILIPYAKGFLSRFSATEDKPDNLLHSYIGPPYSGLLVDGDKFDIILHSYHMDFFMYWIRFRSAKSVKRLAERLLEDDKQMNEWFFQPGRLTHIT